MSTIDQKEYKIKLIGLAGFYAFGYISIFVFVKYLINVNLIYAYVTPWLFLTIPICGFIIIMVWKLFDISNVYRKAAMILFVLSVMTFSIIFYTQINNVYPTFRKLRNVINNE